MKTDIENCSYFTTVYIGSCSLRFQKPIASILKKQNITLKPTYTSKKFLTTSVTKVNGWKY